MSQAAPPAIPDVPESPDGSAPAPAANLHGQLRASGKLVAQLREANQHLVIATVGAQDQLSSAEAANRRQEQFLSMLAHELRNPLAPLAMAAQLLERLADSNPQLPRLQGIISRQVVHMTHLVDDLLDASRISSGKIQLQKRSVTLAEVIDSSLETSQPFIDRRHQQLQLRLPKESIWIDGDRVRLAQVFSNLLINAAKFSPEYEQISIVAKRQGNAVSVAVQDHGIGIALEQQNAIFELFTQGFQTMERSQGGLGIGLALVRSIVELHHGSVSVSSAGLGFGSVFTVMLPMVPAPAVAAGAVAAGAVSAAPGPGMAAKTPGYKILLIEDHADTNDTLSELLQQEGHIIACAQDGHAGLALARHTRFDAIVCDLGLPGMSGYEVARQLCAASKADNMAVPCLIALTGYNHPEHKTRALEAGFAYFLIKPVAMEVLLNLISTRVRQ